MDLVSLHHLQHDSSCDGFGGLSVHKESFSSLLHGPSCVFQKQDALKLSGTYDINP